MEVLSKYGIDAEHWKPSYVSPDYLISDNGKVFSLKRKRLLTNNAYAGYTRCCLFANGKARSYWTHRLVAMAFIPNPENKPCVDHINGNKMDNRVSNLRWVTYKENVHNPNTFYKLKENIERFRRNAIKTAVYKDGNLIGIFETQAEAAKATGASSGNVSWCVSGKLKQTKGYTFKAADL